MVKASVKARRLTIRDWCQYQSPGNLRKNKYCDQTVNCLPTIVIIIVIFRITCIFFHVQIQPISKLNVIRVIKPPSNVLSFSFKMFLGLVVVEVVPLQISRFDILLEFGFWFQRSIIFLLKTWNKICVMQIAKMAQRKIEWNWERNKYLFCRKIFL